MATKPIIFLATMTTIVVTVSAIGAIVGGWEPIKNPKDKHVIEIAEFAVKTYDDQVPKKNLKLVSVNKGEYQVVAGMNYKLIVTATDGHHRLGTQQYQVIVYENLKQIKKLISFIPRE
ncbi:Cysteine proteinase inhibitor 5 [Linum grandiflorum]